MNKLVINIVMPELTPIKTLVSMEDRHVPPRPSST